VGTTALINSHYACNLGLVSFAFSVVIIHQPCNVYFFQYLFGICCCFTFLWYYAEQIWQSKQKGCLEWIFSLANCGICSWYVLAFEIICVIFLLWYSFCSLFNYAIWRNNYFSNDIHGGGLYSGSSKRIFFFEKRRRAAHHYIKKKGKLRSKRTSTKNHPMVASNKHK
jgi:hypothetical protein